MAKHSDSFSYLDLRDISIFAKELAERAFIGLGGQVAHKDGVYIRPVVLAPCWACDSSSRRTAVYWREAHDASDLFTVSVR